MVQVISKRFSYAFNKPPRILKAPPFIRLPKIKPLKKLYMYNPRAYKGQFMVRDRSHI